MYVQGQYGIVRAAVHMLTVFDILSPIDGQYYRLPV